MKILKFIVLALSLALCCSCGPSVYTMQLEMRDPSDAGYDFTGKSVSIVYVYGAEPGDSTFSAALADGLATGFEQDYFEGEVAIPLYVLPYEPGSNYAAKDTLADLICALNSDVVVLIDEPKFSEPSFSEVSDAQTCTFKQPFEIGVYVMDSYDSADTVRSYRGQAVFKVPVDVSGVMTQEELLCRARAACAEKAEEGGRTIASKFTPVWTREEHGIYFYNTDKWLEAADMAAALDYKGAMVKFMELVKSGSVGQKSAAAYDVAFCCYMLREYELAVQWLNISNDYAELPRTSWLRRKILNRAHIL